MYPFTYVLNDGSKHTVNSEQSDNDFKLTVIIPAMREAGQVHIGAHGGFYIAELEEYQESYPKAIKKTT